MILKFIKKSVKFFIVICVLLLIFNLDAIVTLIDCDISDGSISVVGNKIPIENSEFLETYSEIEEKASSLVPNGVVRFLDKVSEFISKLTEKNNI